MDKKRSSSKKKNALYRDFLRKRTKDTEIRYERYKNKLMNILKYSKKELGNNRNNIKRSWEILNSVIKHGAGLNNHPTYFSVSMNMKNIIWML